MNAVLFQRDKEADKFIRGAEENMKFLLADVMTTVTANRLSYFFIACKYSAADKCVGIHFGKTI
jgi:hypothetical protein